MNVVAFVDKFGPLAVEMQYRYNLPALAILGQAAQETGWGASILRCNVAGNIICSNNIFNIKAGTSWTGKKGFVKGAWEVVNGKDVAIDSWFRVYDNPQQSFENYCEYILARRMPDNVTLRYAKAIEFRTNPALYIKAVHAAGYATDPKYSDNVILIFTKYFTAVEERK